MLGPERRKELAALLGRTLASCPHYLLLCDWKSLSGAIHPRQPGFMVPLLSPGPSCSKGAEELSPLPTEAT